jgi:uroporphyrin-III C-methyltransferase/precorrin-2 dehydrogenase/sirohydrochlorin ferrochelatase
MFGRGGEEIDTLAANGIPFQIVPGITAASGCAAYAGIPLTHRDYAQQCIFVTGHQRDGKTPLPWDTLVAPQQTIAIYMGVHGIEQLCDELVAHGMSPDMPAAIVERGTMPEQRVLVSSVGALSGAARQQGYAAPSIIIIGEVVRLRDKLAPYS